MGILRLVTLDPLTSVDECLDPRGHFVGYAVGRIVAALPWEYGTFQVRHHCQVPPVGRSNAGNGAWRAVGIGGVCIVGILYDYIIIFYALGQEEFTLAVSNPYTKR